MLLSSCRQQAPLRVRISAHFQQRGDEKLGRLRRRRSALPPGEIPLKVREEAIQVHHDCECSCDYLYEEQHGLFTLKY